MFEDFVTHINQFYPFKEDLLPQISPYLNRATFKKKEVIVSMGLTCNHIYFLEKGLMRAFYLRGDVEVTNWILHEQQFVTAIQSFYSRKPSKEIVEALETCVVVSIRYDDMMRLCHQSHVFSLCVMKILQDYNAMRDMRNYILRALPATERYEALCQNDPELIRRTSLKIIASYLGVSQETLCRIRKKQKGENLFVNEDK